MTILLVISRKINTLVILKAESFYYYPIFDHMTNIKQNKKKFLASEEATGGVLLKKVFLRKFSEFTGKCIHRKTPVPERLFNKVPGLWPSKKFLRTRFYRAPQDECF